VPSVRKGEKQGSYMKRCVPIAKAEGSAQAAAVGKCMGMYQQKWTASKRKRK
jgi:hypothetical protein